MCRRGVGAGSAQGIHGFQPYRALACPPKIREQQSKQKLADQLEESWRTLREQESLEGHQPAHSEKRLHEYHQPAHDDEVHEEHQPAHDEELCEDHWPAHDKELCEDPQPAHDN